MYIYIYICWGLPETTHLIYIKNLMLNSMDEIIVQKDIQIEKRDKHIDNFQLIVKEKDRKIRWLKIGWTTTGIAAGGAIIYLLLK